MNYNFETNQVYTFDIYPRVYFDTNFNNVTVMGTVGHEIAAKYADIYALHAQVYPTLPTGTPNDPRVFDYLMLKTATGSTTVIAKPWIKEDTIELIQAKTLVVTIDDVVASDISRIKNALLQNGYNKIDINIV